MAAHCPARGPCDGAFANSRVEAAIFPCCFFACRGYAAPNWASGAETCARSVLDLTVSLQIWSELLFALGNVLLMLTWTGYILVACLVFGQWELMRFQMHSNLVLLICILLFRLELVSVQSLRMFETYSHAAAVTYLTANHVWITGTEMDFVRDVGVNAPLLNLIVSWTIAPSWFHFAMSQTFFWAQLWYHVCHTSFFGPSVTELLVASMFGCATVTGYLVIGQLINSKLQQRAVAASLAKESFLNKISHELRTPLAAILGFTETLDSRRLSKNDTESLRSLETATKAGLHLVDEVLDWSRVMRSAPRMDDCFELADLQATTNAIVAPIAAKQRVVLLWDAPDNCAIVADMARVRQVILCFVTNAIKFSPSRSDVTLQLRVDGGPAHESRLRVLVRDQGCGFDPREADRLFEPFVQLNQGATQKGVGLGLAIAKDIIGSMGGEIFAQSAGPARGAHFGFVIPVGVLQSGGRMRAPIPTTTYLLPAVPERDFRLTQDRRLRMLCVEDSPVLLKVLVKQVSMAVGAPVDVDAVSSAVESLAQIESAFASGQQYDVIITDVMMEGGVDGIELALLIRAKENSHGARHTRVIGVSAMTDDSTIARARVFDAFLKKPVTVDQLRVALRNGR